MVIPNRLVWCVVVVAVALAVVLRVAALDSDPYPRLSWSTGLLTDEGYYIHNARNLVTFGTERTDDFNNMLIMPTLHALQVGVFRLWGAGIVQARWISVVCSLLGIVFLFAATKRAFGAKVAAYASVFIGLDHANLLYNRMALMDTPGEMLLILAFYAWVRGAGARDGAAPSKAWMAACGAVLALAFATRGLAGIVIPAAILAAWMASRQVRAQDGASEAANQGGQWRLLFLCAGLSVGLAVYAAVWYLPHREEISRVNHYYLWRQILPNSVPRLALNAANAWFGDERGAAPFLMRHTPAMLLLAVGGLVFAGKQGLALVSGPTRTYDNRTDPTDLSDPTWPSMKYLLCWLAFGAMFLSVTSYSPSRYYLLFYPPLAIVAACGLANAREAIGVLLQSRSAMVVLGGYLAYHAALVTWHHGTSAAMALVAFATIAGSAVGWVSNRALQGGQVRGSVASSQHGGTVGTAHGGTGRSAAGTTVGLTHDEASALLNRVGHFAGPALVVCWACMNAGYYTDWITHLEYNQHDGSRWIATSLPADTVLIGDVAPGLALYNSNPAISVIPGLCNDRQPVERFQGKPRAIVILDGDIKERWWTVHYPELVAESKRVKLFPKIGRFPVGVYLVPEAP